MIELFCLDLRVLCPNLQILLVSLPSPWLDIVCIRCESREGIVTSKKRKRTKKEIFEDIKYEIEGMAIEPEIQT